MNILVIGKGAYTLLMRDTLKSQGHNVFLAFNFYDAMHYWENEKIDCIISCVMIAADGLTEKERKESKNSELAGWVWLKRRVFREYPEMKKRTIIYSAVLEHLKKSVPEAELVDICLVERIGGGADETIKALALIRAELEAMRNRVILYQAQIARNPLEDITEQELRGIHVITHRRARDSGLPNKVITALCQIEASLERNS